MILNVVYSGIANKSNNKPPPVLGFSWGFGCQLTAVTEASPTSPGDDSVRDDGALCRTVPRRHGGLVAQVNDLEPWTHECGPCHKVDLKI